MSKRKIMALAMLLIISVTCTAIFMYSKGEAKASFTRTEVKEVFDPILKELVSERENVLTIPELVEGQENITVIGQVAYSYASSSNDVATNFLLQDVIDGEVVGLLVNDKTNAASYTIGDVVLVTGSVGSYGGVLEFKNVTNVEKIKSEEPFEAQEISIGELKTDASKYVSEYVVIKNAVLEAYDGNNNTYFSDGTGSLPIYRGAAFPEGVTAGSTVDVYCVYSQFKGASQVRVGSSDKYVPSQGVDENEYYVEKSISVIKAEDKEGTLLEDEYFELKFDTTKLGNIKFNFDLEATSDASRCYELFYSLDGENYTKFTKVCLDKQGVSKHFEFTLPSKLNNAKNVEIAVVATGKDFMGVDPVKTNTVKLTNIDIIGSPIKSDKIAQTVDILPAEDEILLNQEIVLSTPTEDAEIYYSVNDSEYQLYNAEEKLYATKLPISIKAYAKKDGLEESLVTTKDYKQVVVSEVKSSPKATSIKLGKVIRLTTDTDEAIIKYSFDKEEWFDYSEGAIVAEQLPMTIYAKATKEGYKDSAISTYIYNEKTEQNYNIYFGQLHSHTTYSDGAGTAQEAFRYASTEAEQVDFMAVTDHSNSFDNDLNASITDASMSEEWNEGRALAKQYTTDSFVGLFGYEMTWSDKTGHMNTFNSPGFQSRNQEGMTNNNKASNSLANYYDCLKKVPESISMFNHPGTTFGYFQSFGLYSEEMDDLIKLVEVGNGEGAIGSSGYFPSYEYYTRALDKGWHVAPTNNQDNHKGKWGNANTGRSVVLANSLSEEDIYDAMSNYRVYATEDNDLEIKYMLDGYYMGETLEKDEVGKNVNIQVDIKDPTDRAIGKVEVIVNNGVSIAEQYVDKTEETLTFEVSSDYTYYYIKITQPDKDIAVTAPIWIGRVEAIGLEEVTKDSSMAVVDEPLNISFGMYNNESKDFNITSIEALIDGEVVEKIDIEKEKLTKVLANSTMKHTFSYTHHKHGNVELQISIKGKYGGVKKEFNEYLSLSYIPNELITNVLIDGTHNNDYVNGYYANNMGNFSDLAADKFIKVHIEKEKITKEMLDDAQLLIITCPAREDGVIKGNGSTGDIAYEQSFFEDEFIQLVKEYVESGKTVMVCGLGDKQDVAGGQTSTKVNKLLEGIGATTRINSDTACNKLLDDAYRLKLTEYNTTDEVFKGLVEGQEYSQYKGSSLILDSNAVETGKVNWLVKGDENYYSKSYADFDDNWYDTSNNIVTTAVEYMNNNGKLYISGAVMMSDFEVKAELDNASSLQYANYTMVNNILDSIAKEVEITPIREVRKANLGDIFTVEGYVTSGTSNENTSFFDAIYVQDDTAGITVFPYANKGLEIGTKVRITGYVDAYQGDIEIQLLSCKILDEEKKIIEPTLMSTKDSMDYDNYGGMLIKTVGKATDIVYTEDKTGVAQFNLVDEDGNKANIFIDGYILSGTTGKNELASVVKEGELVSAVGVLYKHPEGESDVSVPCLRVRNCDEIIAVNAAENDELQEDIDNGNYQGGAYTNFNDNDINNGNTNSNSPSGNYSNTNSTNVDNGNNANDNQGVVSQAASKIKSLIKTGDNSNVLVYVGIAIVALGGIVALVIYRRRKA